ncbi:MAG: ferrous iron transport protein B [Fimbriimonadaceae bacterium]
MSSAPATLPVVVLVGNPNSGKTSLFNALTGSAQKVGNYPGVTVETSSGNVKLGSGPIELLDVPGLYSLRPVSADERIAVDIVSGASKVDAVVAVLDSTSLERGLVLVSELLESDRQTVVALTHADVVRSEGGEVDVPALRSALGCPVVEVVAFQRKGLQDLLKALDAVLGKPSSTQIDLAYPQVVNAAIASLRERFAMAGVDLSASEARHAVLDDVSSLQTQLGTDRPELALAIEEARVSVSGSGGSGRILDAQARYAWASMVRSKVLPQAPVVARRASDILDRYFTHRLTGLIAFIAIMLVVFQSIYTLAGPLTDAIENGVGWLQGVVSPWIAGAPHFQSLVVDGLIGGVGAALVFIPQIAILFLWIAVLEGTGYFARAAFLMDRLFGWCGLNGRAFIPLLSSFACAVPGIMSARVMPDERSRLATVLIAPLMSCSARLPVYVLMVSAFIEPRYGPVWAGVALFGMHAVGLVVAAPIALYLNRKVLRSSTVPFILEMPRYQYPRWRDVSLTVLSRVKAFLQTAGSIIVALSVVIWALTYFPRSAANDQAYVSDYQRLPAAAQEKMSEDSYVGQRRISDSYLGRLGRVLEPAFVPAGYDWRLTTALIAAFPAREVVVSAMGILFGVESDEGGEAKLRDRVKEATWPDGRPLVTLPTAISLMVFFALCCQCMATLAAIRRETNSWKWPIFAFTYMSVMAYLAAVAVFQAGTALGWS